MMHTLVAVILVAVSTIVVGRPHGSEETTAFVAESTLPQAVPTPSSIKKWNARSLPLMPYFRILPITGKKYNSISAWTRKQIKRPDPAPQYVGPTTIAQKNEARLTEAIEKARGVNMRLLQNRILRLHVELPILNEGLFRSEDQKEFAITPVEGEYLQLTEGGNTTVVVLGPNIKGDQFVLQSQFNPSEELEPPRKARQNPNLGREKSLLADDVEKLKMGFAHEDLGPDQNFYSESGFTNNPESFYAIAVVTSIAAAVMIALLGFAFMLYTLAKRAAAAAEVAYPAYGVTGPTVNGSGDQGLAQSAQMYHYQHQKQQISGIETIEVEHTGPFSDPESDENEDGDYTVYECPGFATTADIVINNPLYNEEPILATPAKPEA